MATTVMINNYSILETIDVTKYKSLKDLYRNLLSLKKEVFLDAERIIIKYGSDQQLNLVNELLTTVDIPTFFVVFEKVESVDSVIDFDLTDSFCIYPWINLRVGTLGTVTPCCKFNPKIFSDSINTTDLKDIYLGGNMSMLRHEFRQGNKPVGCQICWKDEAVGLTSMRQHAKYKFREIYYQVDYQNDDFDNLQLLDLNLGNTCNLSCRICNHDSSSSIAKLDHDHDRLSDQKFFELKQAVTWSESESFWNQLLLSAQNLKYLDLYGGEPLMSKNHFVFLKKLIDLGVAENIQIDYNSNGTLYSEKFFDLWKNFKSVNISFSIDDIEDRFEYQRNGAKWALVSENIKKYCSKISNTFTIDIFPTINIQNVYYLPELVSWAQSTDLPINFNILHDPEFLSISNIDTKAKKSIIDKLQFFDHHDVISTVINILKQPNTRSHKEFINYMKTLDSERHQHFQKSHREVANILDMC